MIDIMILLGAENRQCWKAGWQTEHSCHSLIWSTVLASPLRNSVTPGVWTKI